MQGEGCNYDRPCHTLIADARSQCSSRQHLDSDLLTPRSIPRPLLGLVQEVLLSAQAVRDWQMAKVCVRARDMNPQQRCKTAPTAADVECVARIGGLQSCWRVRAAHRHWLLGGGNRCGVIQLSPLVMLAGGRDGAAAWARRRHSAVAMRHAQSKTTTRPHTGPAHDRRWRTARRLGTLRECVCWPQEPPRHGALGSAVKRLQSLLAVGKKGAVRGGMPR